MVPGRWSSRKSSKYPRMIPRIIWRSGGPGTSPGRAARKFATASFRRTGTTVHQSQDTSQDNAAASGSGVRAISQTANDMLRAS